VNGDRRVLLAWRLAHVPIQGAMAMSLVDRVVMITGASEGIGTACAREFLRRGARLSLIDVCSEKPGYDHGNALWTIGDVTDEAVRREAVAATTARLGSVDILLNNAGVSLFASPSETSLVSARRLFAVNFWAAVALTCLVLLQMRQRRSGAVINIESIGGLGQPALVRDLLRIQARPAYLHAIPTLRASAPGDSR
jgi:NAD(P)-dependent dehydrogenase (short-subunit alcohol dehydrogenase family)